MKHHSTPANVSALSNSLSILLDRCFVNYLITGLAQGLLQGNDSYLSKSSLSLKVERARSLVAVVNPCIF